MELGAITIYIYDVQSDHTMTEGDLVPCFRGIPIVCMCDIEMDSIVLRRYVASFCLQLQLFLLGCSFYTGYAVMTTELFLINH